jgi:hypothetical protein
VLEHGRDTTLIRGPDSRSVEEQGVACNFTDRDLVLEPQKLGDFLFPDVGLKTILLLRHDMLAFELSTGPPMHAVVVESDGLS